jgi:uncharacterized membrane protein (DUF106 family)
MLRTGLIKRDGGKLVQVESGISSVSLAQVTPILVVLTSGIGMAIFVTMVERVLLWMKRLTTVKNEYYRTDVERNTFQF